MDRAFIHTPFDEHTVLKPTGVLMGRLDGMKGFRNLGNYESVEYTIEKEEEEIWSPQTPERSKIATLYNEVDVTLNFSLQQLVPIMRTVIMQSEPNLVLTQAAVNGVDVEIEDLEAGGIFPLGYRNVTAIEVTGDAGVYVEGVNYQVDGPTGNFEVMQHPDGGETGTVTVKVTAGAVTGRKLWGIASKIELPGSLMFRSTNRYGPRQLAEFWRCGLTGDGAVPFGSNSNDQGSVACMAKVYADPTKPLSYQYGQVTDLPQT